MSAKDPLQRLAVKSPCSQNWDSMVGNDRVRFCEHCSVQVHNISEMTRARAFRLANKSQGRICVRYYLGPSGAIATKSVTPPLYQLGRRVSRIAAGAFSATISLTAAVAQSPSDRQSGLVPIVQPDGRSALGAALGGTVRDQNGDVIPGATVALSTTGINYFLRTSETGRFRFQQLAAGNYTLLVEAPGFNRVETNIYLGADSDQQVDQTLQVGQIHADVEVLSGENGVQSSISGGAMIATPTNPFVKAAFEDNLEELSSLIAASDVNVLDKATGTTALDHAVGNGNREMVQLLLLRGAEVTKSNKTILSRLDSDATSDLVWDLINAGAEVNARSETGDTPLMAAAYEENGEILKTLLEAGADIHSKNEDGQTALMVAAENGRLQNVRALVLAGADINQVDAEGKNALMLAIESEHRTVIRFLRSKGALESIPQSRVDE